MAVGGVQSGRGRADGALVEALAAGLSVREAAGRARISERTAHRRLADPLFRELVARTRGEMRGRAVGRLADGSSRAAATLEDLLGAVYAPAVRLGAARAILEHAARMGESVELQERIAALERQEEGRNAAQPAASR